MGVCNNIEIGIRKVYKNIDTIKVPYSNIIKKDLGKDIKDVKGAGATGGLDDKFRRKI